MEFTNAKGQIVNINNGFVQVIDPITGRVIAQGNAGPNDVVNNTGSGTNINGGNSSWDGVNNVPGTNVPIPSPSPLWSVEDALARTPGLTKPSSRQKLFEEMVDKSGNNDYRLRNTVEDFLLREKKKRRNAP